MGGVEDMDKMLYKLLFVGLGALVGIVLCMLLARILDIKNRKTKETKRTDLCGAARYLYDAFFGFCACIGGRNEKRSGQS